MVTKIEADYKHAVLTERSPKIVLARVNMRETEDTEQVTSNKDKQI